jgi:hypothetical protein
VRRFLPPLLIALALVGLFWAVGAAVLGGGLVDEVDAYNDRVTDATLEYVEEDEDFGEVAVYDVLADGSLDPQPEGVTAEVWDLWVRLIGADVAGESISQFRVGDSDESDTLAYVYQGDNPQVFTLAVNLATADDEQLMVATLVHEYAHVFSFGPGEFDRKAPSCDTFEVIEGCAEPDSYLWAFYDAFWTGYDEHPDLENVDPDIAYEFYLANEEDFVSDYAATNIGEDFAESFMTFVLEDDWSTDTDTVTGAKLEFFTQYPELVALREQMRAGAAEELGL